MTTSVSDGYIESRLVAALQLVITFDSAVAPGSVLPGAVTITGQTGGNVSSLIQSMSLDGAATRLTLTLSSALPNGDLYTVAVTGLLQNTEGHTIFGDADVQIRVLVGDVDASGRSTPADVRAIRQKLGQAASVANARYDVDGSGTISEADMIAARQNAR